MIDLTKISRYQENNRIVSSSGEWSGNVYDFYFRVYNKIGQDIKTPFKLDGGDRVDDTPVHQALREALANCLVNADYYGRQGIVVIKRKDMISISNPGGFRIDLEAAKSGGISGPRNTTMIKMFNLVNIRERAGSGIFLIFMRFGNVSSGVRRRFVNNLTRSELSSGVSHGVP